MLPCALLATMVLIGLVLEAMVYGEPQLGPKLPLGLLLALTLLRRRRAREGGR